MKAGSRYASVLPVPVSACKYASFPASNTGTAALWIGVGAVICCFASAAMRSGGSCRSVNVMNLELLEKRTVAGPQAGEGALLERPHGKLALYWEVVDEDSGVRMNEAFSSETLI